MALWSSYWLKTFYPKYKQISANGESTSVMNVWCHMTTQNLRTVATSPCSWVNLKDWLKNHLSLSTLHWVVSETLSGIVIQPKCRGCKGMGSSGFTYVGVKPWLGDPQQREACKRWTKKIIVGPLSGKGPPRSNKWFLKFLSIKF